MAADIELKVAEIKIKAVEFSNRFTNWVDNVRVKHRYIKNVICNRYVKVILIVILAAQLIKLKYHYFGYKSMFGGVLGGSIDGKLRRMLVREVKAGRRALIEALGLPLARLEGAASREAMSWTLEVLIRRFRQKKVMARVEMSAMNWDKDCVSPLPRTILQANVGSSYRPFPQNDSDDFVTFDSADLRVLIKNSYPKLLKLFDASTNPDHQVFLWSLCAVHRYGGVVFGPSSTSRKFDDIENIQQLKGLRREKCFKMGYVQYNEKGYLNFIAAPPQHSLLQCVIESLESKQSLEDSGSISVFFLGHSTKVFDSSEGFKLFLMPTKKFSTCEDSKLMPLSEISSLEDPGSAGLFLELVPVTRSTPPSVRSISVSISESGGDAPSRKSTHRSLLRSLGCEPGWFCDRCIRSAAHGTYAACSAFCNSCYMQAICGSDDSQEKKTVVNVDVNVIIPPQGIGQRMIPRIIHQTWFEDISAVRYPQLFRWQNSWKNSGWEYRFYNDTEARMYIKDNFPARFLDTYDALVPGAFKADLFRYLVLLRDGGVYADVDVLLETNLDSFITPTLSFFTARDDGIASGQDQQFCLWNGIVAAAPGHPIMAKAVERVLNLVMSRADLFDMEREMCQKTGMVAEAWKTRLVPILLLSGPCALGAATNDALGKSNLLARFDLGWLPFNTTSAGFPQSFREGLILKADKLDMEGQRFTDVDRNIMLASTDVVDLNKAPLLPPRIVQPLLREKHKEPPPHYSYLEHANEVFGSLGVYADNQVEHEVVKLALYYREEEGWEP